MPRFCDRWQKDYLPTQAIANGATLVGPIVTLDGSSAVTVQVVTSNSGAGTVYVDATNDDGAGATFVTTPAAGQSVAANSTGFLSYTLTDQLTGFAQMRVRFVASAAGNVRVATNVRRSTNT